MPVEVKTKSGQRFYVEVDAAAQPNPIAEPTRDLSLSPKGSDMGTIEPTMFDKAVAVIQEVAQDVSDGLLSTDPRPSEVEMTVNIGFDAGGNIWFFKGGTNASLKLVLRWKFTEPA